MTIARSVTVTGDEAFYDCSTLTSITIPDSLTKVGYQAFVLPPREHVLGMRWFSRELFGLLGAVSRPAGAQRAPSA